MKNKWRMSVLAAIAALSLVLDAACDSCSCNDDDLDKSQSSAPTGENPVSKTEEEIFAAVKAGMENTATYQGAYSEQSNALWQMGSEEERENWQVAVDPATNRAVSKGESSEGDSRQSKIFERVGKSYYFCSRAYENRVDTDYFEITPTEMDSYMEEVGDHGYGPSEVATKCDSFALAANFDVFKDAFATVTQNSVVKMGEGFSGEVAVSAKYENGLDCVYVSLQGQNVDMQGQATLCYAVKNGKLAEFHYEMENTRQGQKVIAEASVVYTYSFDKDLYASVTTEGAELETDRDTSEYMSIQFVLNDQVSVVGHASINANDTVATLFADVEEVFYRKDGMQKKVVEVDSWYLDKQCTQKLNMATLTVESLAAIDTLYAKSYTVQSGYALYIPQASREDKRTDPYKIAWNIVGIFGGVGSAVDSKSWIYDAGDKITLHQDSYGKILVNGIVTEEETLTLESGKTYVVERISYSEDADLNIFEDFFEIL